MGESLRRYVSEPYRRKLAIMAHRLEANLVRVRTRMAGRQHDHLPEGYGSDRDFLATSTSSATP
jgi:phosphoenolpyruvate carboxylase